MSRRVVGLVGFARTGKDSVADYLVEQHGFKRISSADFLRDLAYAINPLVVDPSGMLWGDLVRLADLVDRIGWDRAKVENSEVRRLLQAIGTEGCRNLFGADCWIDLTVKAIKAEPGQDFVVTDVRFPNEAAAVRTVLGGQTWRIARPGVGPLNDHPSEMQVLATPADQLLVNDADLESLYARVDGALAAYAGRCADHDPWPGATALGRHFTGGPSRHDVV